MSQLDREGLISQSNALFPNNTAQEITPNDIRQFDLDVIDSFALTGSLVVSASYAVSASQAENANTSISASHALHSDTTQEVIINVKNTSGVELVKGTPVYATGVTGDNINIASASNDSSNTMPAIAVLGETLTNNQSGVGVVSGKIIGVDTDGFTAGRNIYVNTNGDYTQTKPTGTKLIQNIGVVGKVNASEGEIVIQGSGRSNDLPNIQDGYLWVGDGSGVPQAVATSSIVTDVDTGSLATTGSNTFNGNQTISGSLNVQDTNAPMTGISLTNALGTGKVQIIPGGDFVTTFNEASLTGIDTYAGSTLSGSWGEVGDITGAGIGIQNALLDGGNQGIYLSHGNYDAWVSAPNGTTAIKGDTITLTPSSSAATSVQLTGDVTFNDELIAKENIQVLNPSGNPYIRIGNTTQQYQFAGMEVYTNRTINPGNQYAGFTVFDTGNSMNGGININTYTGVDGSNPVFQLFGGGGGGGAGQTILAAKDDSTVEFLKYNKFNNTTEFNNNVIGNGPSEFKQKMQVNTSNNPSPGNIFEVTHTGTPAYQVANSALAGITGLEIINDMQHGDFIVNNASGSRIKVYEQSRGTAAGRDVEINGSTLIGGANSDVTISAGTSGRTLLLSGSNVTLESGTPMNINSAVTFNGAMLVNSAIYQGQDTLGYPSGSITNQYDYFFVPLTPLVTKVNVDSFLGEGRTVNLLVEQTSGTGLVELQYSGGPTGTTQLFGPSAAVSGSFLTPSTTPGSYTAFELKAYNKGGSPANIIVVTNYEPNLVIGDITQWRN